MPNAEELEKIAAQKKAEQDKKDKPLPAMVSPTVNLAVELRQAVSLRCRETSESFSTVSNKMWLEILKKEKRVKADLSPDFSAKRIGSGLKVKLEEKDVLIADLQKQLAELKAAKR